MSNVEGGEQREGPRSFPGALRPDHSSTTLQETAFDENVTSRERTADECPNLTEATNEVTADSPNEVSSPSSRDRPDPQRKIRRKLTPFQLIMITINGTLGAGLYVQSGRSLQLAGPMAAFMPFLMLTFLAWWVMLCITELLCLWPVPGALPLFVTKFVDKELGQTVAIAYWFTYAVGFSALVAVCASSLSYWATKSPVTLHATFYAILPFVLGMVNSLEIGVYGWIEAITGVIKLIMLFVVIISLIALDAKGGMSEVLNSDWHTLAVYDEKAATSFGPAFIIAFPIATFAFTGVEIIAASIIEARWTNQHDATLNSNGTEASEDNGAPKNANYASTIRNSAVILPIAVGAVYVLSGVLVAIGLSRSDSALPKLSWLESVTSSSTSKITTTPTSDPTSTIDSTSTAAETSSAFPKLLSSPFTIIAENSDTDKLNDVFNAFILFTAITCANTNLYVASRTLFGIAINMCAPRGPSRVIAWFGLLYTNGVPVRAVWVSLFSFYWVPFLEIAGGFRKGSSFTWAVSILSQAGSVSAIMVWACQCLAYIRFRNCTIQHLGPLQDRSLYLLRDNDYPYRSHGQPLVAWGALVLSLVVLAIFNSAFMWKKFQLVPFLAGFVPIFVFLFIWVGLKLWNSKSLGFTELGEREVLVIFKDLNDLRYSALAEDDSTPEPQPNGA